ncbi:moronecidin-like [Xiphophorus maculatus]|uniref:moronecidin-like n=1 Tax=Xiphophorus maculatus TaxID=8083 RepID=UPI0003B62C45|nr:moronecidin-like [Xiphophorus maculatus]
MKCSVIIFVLSAVVLAAQPGEGFLHLLPGIIKDVGHGINGLAHLIHGPGDNEVQADQQQLAQQEVDQQEVDQQKLAQQEVDQQKLAQQKVDQQQQLKAVKYRIA